MAAASPRIMGILNVTPDSFSGDGLLTGKDYVTVALDLAAQMVADGADMLDIGGESSRPGSEPVSAEEEIRRTVPVIKAIREMLDKRGRGAAGILPPLRGELEGGSAPQKPKIGFVEATPHPTSPSRGEERAPVLISIDTVKAEVAAAALDAGASIVNDISALHRDAAMAALVAKRGAYLVLMHNRSDPAAVTKDTKVGGEYGAAEYGDIVEDVSRDLAARAEIAQKAGVAKDKIILDPGIGFGKTVEQNLALIHHVDRLRKLEYPVLIGPSRKSFIGRVLDLPVDERLEGTAALVAISAFQGADIIRVHDVKFMARVARMAGAGQVSGHK